MFLELFCLIHHDGIKNKQFNSYCKYSLIDMFNEFIIEHSSVTSLDIANLF